VFAGYAGNSPQRRAELRLLDVDTEYPLALVPKLHAGSRVRTPVGRRSGGFASPLSPGWELVDDRHDGPSSQAWRSHERSELELDGPGLVVAVQPGRTVSGHYVLHV